jgi:NTP pyrophosphatase (non-canonical NTP hydrolase)
MGLDFEEMSTMNAQRAERWHGRNWLDAKDPWSLADWANAMGGEAGEAQNIVKKMRRIEANLWDKQTYPGDATVVLSRLAQLHGSEAYEELREMLGNELADVVLYADLLAQKAGLDLAACVRTKFNRTSEVQNFPERL